MDGEAVKVCDNFLSFGLYSAHIPNHCPQLSVSNQELPSDAFDRPVSGLKPQI